MTSARRILILFILLFACSIASAQPEDNAANVAQNNQAQNNLAQSKLDKARQIVDSGAANVDMKPAADIAKQDMSLASSATKMMQQLGLLIGVLLIGVWALKKWVIKETPLINRQIKIIDRIAIDQRTRLTLVEVSGEKILVGHSSSDVSMISVGTIKKEGKDFDISLSEAIKE